MKNIFKFLKLMMAVIMLLDSTVIFAAKSKKKKKGNRKRTALSYKISRGKAKSKSVKDGELSFDNVGTVFKKTAKNSKAAAPATNPQPPVTTLPAPTPEPENPPPTTPEPDKDTPTPDTNIPDIQKPLPFVPPYRGVMPRKPQKQNQEPNKELAEIIKQLKDRFASAKNTCGAYTQNMVHINKDLGLGVQITSGIGMGLSAIATVTGAVGYGKSKKQDKNLKAHGENQDALRNMKLDTFGVAGGVGDDDDLSKLKFTKNDLPTDKIEELKKAKEAEAAAKEKWEEAEGKAKTAEDDLNKPLSEEDEEKMPEIEIPQNLQTALDNAKNMSVEPKGKKPEKLPKKPAEDPEEKRVAQLERDANTALEKAKNMSVEPKENPKKPATPKKPTKEEIDEKNRVEGLKKAAEKAAKDIQEAEQELETLKEPQPKDKSEKLKKAEEAANKAAQDLKDFDKGISDKKAERDRIIAAGKKAKADLAQLLKEKQALKFDPKKHNAKHKEKCEELRDIFRTQDVCSGERESNEIIKNKIIELKNAFTKKYKEKDKGTYYHYMRMLSGTTNMTLDDLEKEQNFNNLNNVNISQLNNLVYLLQKLEVGMLCPPRNEESFNYNDKFYYKKKQGYSAVSNLKYTGLRSAGFEIQQGNEYNSLVNYLNTPGNCCEAGKFPDCQYPQGESEEKRKAREEKIKQAEADKKVYEDLLNTLKKEEEDRKELDAKAQKAKKEKERLEKEENGANKQALEDYKKRKAELEAKRDEAKRKAKEMADNAAAEEEKLNKKLAEAKSAKELAEQKKRDAEIAKLKSKQKDAIEAANKLIAEAAEERKKLNEKKQKDAIAAKEKEELDKKEEIEKLEAAKKAAIAKAEQAIKDYEEQERAKWNNDKEAKKAKLLEEKKKNAEELRKKADDLKGLFDSAKGNKEALEEEAKKQQDALDKQKEEQADIEAKQSALADSTATIKKNHKVARGLDIATATLSAVSAVSSTVSMGFSIATVEAIKKAINQLKDCKADIYQIKLLNGKFTALTAGE